MTVALERRCDRRAADGDAVRAANAASARRCRQRHAAEGLTFHELWQRVGGDRQTLAHVLRDEVRQGRVVFRSTSRRYVLNGELDPETRVALRTLGPLEFDESSFAAHANAERDPYSAGREAADLMTA